MATIVPEATKPLGPGDAGTPMTMDEFEQAEYELGYRYELINGVLIVNPPPLEEERDANQLLGHLLISRIQFLDGLNVIGLVEAGISWRHGYS